MGHALDNTLQDILIRWKRMQGFKTLWIPGTDHAGIATQNVVEKELKKEGKRKEDIGREEFIKLVWQWKEKYGGNITRQLRRLGASCDWTRERFTMDEGLSMAVRRHFVQLYNEGLIYRGKRLINWCPRCKTALSDIEVEHHEEKSHLWYIKYPIDGQKDFVVVATTRPETMLGDTAVAVNPTDERYKHLIGKMLILPLVGRKIPIIADDFVDPTFGTGAVKVTPAHDPNDFEMAERHGLEKINILHEDGTIAFEKYEGIDRFKARELIVKELEDQGFLEKIEDYTTSIGKCYRCKTIEEPYLSDQWFVKTAVLAKDAISAVETGKIKFVPDRWTKVYLNWMNNIKDWCISRQIWWGHRIPVWYCACGEVIVREETPTKCPECGGTNLRQDPDVLDTWFSSGLWPFSTLGWPARNATHSVAGGPDETNDLITFYPTSVLITGYDIIFFWVARMIMAGMHFMKKEPFKVVNIHGLIRDITGKKMSKSIGNVIDPIDIIDHTGADALRFALTSLALGGGQDLKLSENKVTEARNFANKIWNVSRFVLMNLGDSQNTIGRSANVGASANLVDSWIISRYNQTIKDVTNLLESYSYGEAARRLYDFIWGEFCDWYVELAKIDINKSMPVLLHVLDGILKLLHPIMPFITEEIWQILKSQIPNLPAGKAGPKSQTIMLAQWPIEDEKMIDSKVEEEMQKTFDLIRGIRNIRSLMDIPYSKEIEVILVSEKENPNTDYIKHLVKASDIKLLKKIDQKPKHSASMIIGQSHVYIPLEGLIDFEKEAERLKMELNKVQTEITKLEAKLSNVDFAKNAPEDVVAEVNNSIAELNGKKAFINEQIKSLG